MFRTVALLALQPETDADSFPALDLSLKPGSLFVTYYMSWNSINRCGIAIEWEVQQSTMWLWLWRGCPSMPQTTSHLKWRGWGRLWIFVKSHLPPSRMHVSYQSLQCASTLYSYGLISIMSLMWHSVGCPLSPGFFRLYYDEGQENWYSPEARLKMHIVFYSK